MPSSPEGGAGDFLQPVAPSRRARTSRAGTAVSSVEVTAERGAWALWATLVALALIQFVSSLVPGMALWGFNVGRFLPPLGSAALATAVLVPLVPAIARAIAPALERAGEALAARGSAGSGALAVAMLVLGTMALVWIRSDRAWLVGDFPLGATGALPAPEELFPQALPLDRLLHFVLPSALARGSGLDHLWAERALAALEAGALAFLCTRLPRVLGLRGIPAATATCVALFGGSLCLFTGYGKALREMCLLVAATAVYGLRALEAESAAAGPALAAAVGFVLHRSSVMFLSPLAALVALGSAPAGMRPRRRGAVLAAGAALLVFAAMAPRTLAVFRQVDPAHFEPLAAGQSASSGLIDPVHVLDVISVVAQLSLPAFALLFLMPLLAPTRRREAAFFAALLLPLLLLLIAIHPRQGPFRDWDVFASAGVGLSFAAAWAIGRVLERAPRLGWVGVAACAGVIAPTLAWLGHFHSPDAALHRVEAYLAEPPARPEAEQATLCDYLGARYGRLGRWDAAADAYARAVQAAPSPRLRYQWAEAEALRGRLGEAQRILLDLTGLSPQMAPAWSALAQVSLELNQPERALEAARQALARSPDDPVARRVMRELAVRADRDTTRGSTPR